VLGDVSSLDTDVGVLLGQAASLFSDADYNFFYIQECTDSDTLSFFRLFSEPSVLRSYRVFLESLPFPQRRLLILFCSSLLRYRFCAIPCEFCPLCGRKWLWEHWFTCHKLDLVSLSASRELVFSSIKVHVELGQWDAFVHFIRFYLLEWCDILSTVTFPHDVIDDLCWHLAFALMTYVCDRPPSTRVRPLWSPSPPQASFISKSFPWCVQQEMHRPFERDNYPWIGSRTSYRIFAHMKYTISLNNVDFFFVKMHCAIKKIIDNLMAILTGLIFWNFIGSFMASWEITSLWLWQKIVQMTNLSLIHNPVHHHQTPRALYWAQLDWNLPWAKTNGWAHYTSVQMRICDPPITPLKAHGIHLMTIQLTIFACFQPKSKLCSWTGNRGSKLSQNGQTRIIDHSSTYSPPLKVQQGCKTRRLTRHVRGITFHEAVARFKQYTVCFWTKLRKHEIQNRSLQARVFGRQEWWDDADDVVCIHWGKIWRTSDVAVNLLGDIDNDTSASIGF
jgi:hypothetical protein